jgi:hypothetical protein
MARTDMLSSVYPLQQLVRERQTAICELAQRLWFLEEWNRLLRSRRFSVGSKQIPIEQARPFNEAELAAIATEKGDSNGEIDVRAHKNRDFSTSLAALREN